MFDGLASPPSAEGHPAEPRVESRSGEVAGLGFSDGSDPSRVDETGGPTEGLRGVADHAEQPTGD